jgi:chemotaxis protein methyltransferase CheR
MAFTYFFRDQHTLDLIAEHVIPELKRHMYINIWDAGCAMGPEPYSLAITLRENMGPFHFRNVRIVATDIDEGGDFGEIIARGVYSERGIQRVPALLLTKYFTPLPGGRIGETHYKISDEMRKAVNFQRHDLLSLTPIRYGFGLIVCKNVLLHFQAKDRSAVIRMFYEALADDGYLVTEQTQKLPGDVGHLFEHVTGAGQVFRKIAPVNKEDVPIQTVVPSRIAGSLRIAKDHAFSGVSTYTWLNLEGQGERVGKMRVRMVDETLTIYSLTIFPEFQGHGCAREVISSFQETYHQIVADKVRAKARGFWEKLGFDELQNGDYIWRRSPS